MTSSPLPRAAAVVLVAAAAAHGAALAGAPRPVVSLSATPAHLTLRGRVPQTLVVHNDGATRVRLAVKSVSFTFDLYGNAVLAPRSKPPRTARGWLRVTPRRLVLAPGGQGVLRIVARPPRQASSGDHHALVLLSTLVPARAHLAVRTRIGVVVLVRVPGRMARRLVVGSVRVAGPRRARLLLVTVRNRGNVAERLLPDEVTVTLRRGRRVAAVARALARVLLPHSRGVLVAPLRRGLRGRFLAVVRIAAQGAEETAPPLRAVRKAVRLRL